MMATDDSLGCDCPTCAQPTAMLALFGAITVAGLVGGLIRWLL